MPDHMFNPDNKFNLNNMRIDARKRAERDGRVTIIHSHSAETFCKGKCEEITPEDEDE